MTDRPGQRAWRVFRVSCCAQGVDGLRRSGTRGIEGPSLGGVELLDPLQEIGWEHQGLDAPDGAGEDEFELRPGCSIAVRRARKRRFMSASVLPITPRTLASASRVCPAAPLYAMARQKASEHGEKIRFRTA